MKLFRENFVENNDKNCFLIINGKILELKESIDLNDIYDNYINTNWPMELEVMLIERKNKRMKNLSYMFSETTIKELLDIHKFDMVNINDMNHMFYNCNLIKELPDIANWNTKNVTDMSYMFCGCESLYSIPDITVWKLDSLKYMNYMFKNCSSLCCVFNNKKWRIREDIQKEGLFEGCLYLNLNDNSTSKYQKFLMKIFNSYLKENCLGNSLFIFCIICFFIIFVYIIFFYPFEMIYPPFHLDSCKKFTSYPIEYLNLTNFIDNANNSLSDSFNFTLINQNMTFTSMQYYYQIYTVLHIIPYLSQFLILIILIICSEVLKTEKADSCLFTMLFLFSTIAIIFGYLVESIMKKLLKSMSAFLKGINTKFPIQIPLDYTEELIPIEELLNYRLKNWVITPFIPILFICLVFQKCRRKFKENLDIKIYENHFSNYNQEKEIDTVMLEKKNKDSQDLIN